MPRSAQFDTTTLARSLIMVGVSGDTTEIPAWLGADGTPGSGAFVIDGEDGLSSGSFAALAKGTQLTTYRRRLRGRTGQSTRFPVLRGAFRSRAGGAINTVAGARTRSRQGRAMKSVGVNTDFAPWWT